MLTYCKERYQASRCGRRVHAASRLLHIPWGPISACSHTTTENVIAFITLQ